MMWKRPRSSSQAQESIFKGVMLANFVLLFHVALILGVAFIAFFSGGVIEYLPWVLTVGGVLIVGSVCLGWRRMKEQGKHLAHVLNDPTFQNRTIEVNLLGGLASLRLGLPQELPMIPHKNPETQGQLKPGFGACKSIQGPQAS